MEEFEEKKAQKLVFRFHMTFVFERDFELALGIAFRFASKWKPGLRVTEISRFLQDVQASRTIFLQ